MFIKNSTHSSHLLIALEDFINKSHKVNSFIKRKISREITDLHVLMMMISTEYTLIIMFVDLIVFGNNWGFVISLTIPCLFGRCISERDM